MVTHRLSTAGSADQILAIDEGGMIEVGTHAELVAAGGRYARFAADQVRAAGWRLKK